MLMLQCSTKFIVLVKTKSKQFLPDKSRLDSTYRMRLRVIYLSALCVPYLEMNVLHFSIRCLKFSENIRLTQSPPQFCRKNYIVRYKMAFMAIIYSKSQTMTRQRQQDTEKNMGPCATKNRMSIYCNLYNQKHGLCSQIFRLQYNATLFQILIFHMPVLKVIIDKSRGEVSLMEQDTIENVSQPIFFSTF